MELRLLTLYPDRMNIYADRGNAVFLRKRCEWRGIRFRHSGAQVGETINPEAHDLLYIGGGQDADQRAVAEDLLTTKQEALQSAVEDGAPLLAVCGGYQLLGHHYAIDQERLPGLGLVDAETTRVPGPRLVGNVEIETVITPHEALTRMNAPEIPTGANGGPLLVGFENHGGRTRLGPGAKALGRVLTGHGNNGEDGSEGVVRENLIGTYLHGPLLPKNWWLADHLIATALARRYRRTPILRPLGDELEIAANRRARRAATVI